MKIYSVFFKNIEATNGDRLPACMLATLLGEALARPPPNPLPPERELVAQARLAGSFIPELLKQKCAGRRARNRAGTSTAVTVLSSEVLTNF